MPDPTLKPTAKRKLEWREACDVGSWWWMTGDPDTDVMLSEDEHAAVAKAFEEAAEILWHESVEVESEGHEEAAAEDRRMAKVFDVIAKEKPKAEERE